MQKTPQHRLCKSWIECH